MAIAILRRRYGRRVSRSVAGPTSYPAGGFTVTIGELDRIQYCRVVARTEELLKATDINYSVEYSWSGNVVTIAVYVQTVTNAAGAATWGEIAAGTNLSGITFEIRVEGR